MADLHTQLRALLGDRTQTGAALREQHGATTTWLRNQPPDIVVWPETAEEVSRIVRLSAAAGVPIIPFGAGTSLEGQVNAPSGGICVDMTRMNNILCVNAEDMDCVVQPGVTRKQLNTHLRDSGLFFPLDPGADATLGGMASTRASGTTAVRYGTMRDAVLSLRAVMADGTEIHTGGRARKSSAGLDLTRLLIGAEGTLGIITELTLRLHGIPEAIKALRCSFPSTEAACRTAITALQSALPVARLELLDAETTRALNAYSGLKLPEAPTLLCEFHGTPNGVAETAEIFRGLADEEGGYAYTAADTPEERGRLWQARHDVFWACSGLRPGAKGISTDVCVPISRLAECLAAAEAKVAEMGLCAPVAGHVGDGNFHHLILIDPNKPEDASMAQEYIGWLNDLAISMDGTCTGEHGVGQGKSAYLEREFGKAVNFMRRVKYSFDPDGLFNPGKMFNTLG